MGGMVNIAAHKLRVIERVNNEDEVSFFDALWIKNTFFSNDVYEKNPKELIVNKIISMSDTEFETFCSVLRHLREAKELATIVNKA